MAEPLCDDWDDSSEEEKPAAAVVAEVANDASAVERTVAVPAASNEEVVNEPVEWWKQVIEGRLLAGSGLTMLAGETNSLSAIEWESTEAPLDNDTAQTHRYLADWMMDQAKDAGLLKTGREKESESESEDEDPDEKAAQPATDKAGSGATRITFSPKGISDFQFRDGVTELAVLNWVWMTLVRPKLQETGIKLSEQDPHTVLGYDEADAVFREFVPKTAEAMKPKKEETKKEDKKGKEVKPKKKKEVKLNTKEKIQVAHFVKDMLLGEIKDKDRTGHKRGWVGMLGAGLLPLTAPWDFHLAEVMYQSMNFALRCKKMKDKKDKDGNDPFSRMDFYEQLQSLADCISMVNTQAKIHFGDLSGEVQALKDSTDLQLRLQHSNMIPQDNFDLRWYLQNGAHLLAGSAFAKKHTKTVFRPFDIQCGMVQHIIRKGPQLVFSIAPPGTGKTAIVSHLLKLFTGHSLVFCCAALPVVLGTGQVAHALGIPYAYVKGKRVTPAHKCGRGLGGCEDHDGKGAVELLREKIIEGNKDRKKKRLAEKKKKRGLFDVKREPKLYLCSDVTSCGWLLRQLDPYKTILVLDEPPMGCDLIPTEPKDNLVAAHVVETMLLPCYKTIWMSATMPQPNQLPTLVDHFLQRFHLTKENQHLHVSEAFSTQLDRGVLLVRPSGRVAFPHEVCKTAKDLQALCKRLPREPLVWKAYTERALSQLLRRWGTFVEAGSVPAAFSPPPPEEFFHDLSTIRNESIRVYSLTLLEEVAKGGDAFVAEFCAVADDEKAFPPFNLDEMLFSDAYAYPGLSLVADDAPKERMLQMAQRLIEHMPKVEDLEADLKAQEAAQDKETKMMSSIKDKDDRDANAEPESQLKLKFQSDLVINSEAFLKRWCGDKPLPTGKAFFRPPPSVNQFMSIKQLPVTEVWQSLALCGAASFDPTLDENRANPIYTQWVHENMSGRNLACVTAGREFTWGANVPSSTVVVTSSFASKTSVAGILQYVGRAARRGLTTHGQALFENDDDLTRMFESSAAMSTEAQVMERYAQWWLSCGETW